MDLGLTRRRALLIGNHRAILEACASALLAEGAAVAAARGPGGHAIEGAVPLEPSLNDAPLALADAARTALGGVDIVVSAFEFDGGALDSGGSEERLIQGWDELTAMATLYQSLAKDMKAQGFGRLIWAGPTEAKVLTARLAHILATRRAGPGQILSVTFTNKAAREMQHRVGHLIGGAVEGMRWLGTFHAIAAKMLRRLCNS